MHVGVELGAVGPVLRAGASPAYTLVWGALAYFMTSVSIYPRTILSTPGTSSYRLSYKQGAQSSTPQTFRIGYLLAEAMLSPVLAARV